MSSFSEEASSFGIADYAVFVLMLVVSAGIGVYYAWVDRRKRSSDEFLTGGRTLTALPVSMSLTASIMSSVTLMSNPAEVYRYGAMFGLIGIAYALSVVVSSEIFLPVFYKLGITSIYEYLELRFNKATRLLGTVSFLIQTILFTGVIAYGPALALNRVFDMNLWVGITSTVIVCTFYCTLGGLKAVVWTDVFQIGVMLSGFVAVIIKSVMVQGGIFTIFSDSQQGGRLNFWDFDMNPLRRHTFWTLVVGGTFVWSTVYGISPTSVQRYVSCKSITHARLALYINLLGLYACLVSTLFAGMCLYSIYKNCDPWTAGLVSSPDQLMPHLVMEIFARNPGVPGLFLAAIYSGSLSTVSSCINGLAAVTLEDLIKPYIKISEKHQLIISKGLTFFYGVVSIAMAGLTSFMGGGMMQSVAVIGSVTGGPLLGLFSLGMLCPFANSKGALSGLVSGFVATLCVSIGDLISPSPPEMTRPLSLTTEGCNVTAGDHNWTSTVVPNYPGSVTTTPLLIREETHHPSGNWRSPSYLYFCLIGTVTTLIVGLIVSLLTGGCKETVNQRLTLHKEDTTFYHLFRLIKAKVGFTAQESHQKIKKSADVCVVPLQVITPAGEFDMMKRPESGNTNPDFCNLEVNYKSKTYSNF